MASGCNLEYKQCHGQSVSLSAMLARDQNRNKVEVSASDGARIYERAMGWGIGTASASGQLSILYVYNYGEH